MFGEHLLSLNEESKEDNHDAKMVQVLTSSDHSIIEILKGVFTASNG
jgi:hypothetical protein